MFENWKGPKSNTIKILPLISATDPVVPTPQATSVTRKKAYPEILSAGLCWLLLHDKSLQNLVA